MPALSSAALYVALFGALGIFYPYIAIWMMAKGLTAGEVSLVIGVPLVLRVLVAPHLGRIADGMADRRLLLFCLVGCTAVLGALLGLQNGFSGILIVGGLMMVFWQALTPVIEAIVVSLVRRGVVPDYGRLRLWGSLSYAVTVLLFGVLLESGGPGLVIPGTVAALAFLAVLCLFAPTGAPVDRTLPLPKLGLSGRPDLIMLFLAVALILASQAMFTNFGGVQMLRLGYSGVAIGALWTISIVAEVVILWFASGLVIRFGALNLLIIGAICSALRWMGFAFEPSVVVAGLLQVLHAGTVGCTLLGMTSLVARLVDDKVGAQAQGAFVNISGLCMAATVLVTGPLFQAFGSGAYWSSVALTVAALAVTVALRGRLKAMASS